MTRDFNPKSIKVTVLLTLMVALGPLSTDLYLPSLPSLTAFFDTTVSQVQATLSVFIAGFAVATMIYGPLSDRFGRRPCLIGGLTIFALGSVGCMAAGSVEALIGWRFVQAVGGCAGPVLSRAIVRDVYEREEAARLLSYMASAMALAPAVAPMLGGVLHVLFGWRSHFVALAVFGLAVTCAVVVLLSETNAHPDRRATGGLYIWKNLRTLFGDSLFVAYTSSMTFAYGALFSFISLGAFVVIDVLTIAPDQFGYLFFFIAFGFIVGGVLSGRWVTRLGIDRLIGAGIGVGVFVGLIGFVLAALGIENVTAVILPVTGVFFACGLVLPNATAGALIPFPLMAGTASSVIGFLQMSGGAAIGYAAGLLHDGTTQPLFMVILLSWMISGAVFVVARRRGVIRLSGGAKNG